MYHTQTHTLSNIRGIRTRAADQQEHAVISTARTADQQKHAAQQPVMRCSHVSLATIDLHTLYPEHLPQKKKHTAAFCTTEAQHMRKPICLSNIRGIITRAADPQDHALISTAHTAYQQKYAAQKGQMKRRHHHRRCCCSSCSCRKS